MPKEDSRTRRVWFNRVSKADADEYVKWWNANTKGFFFFKEKNGRFWNVIRIRIGKGKVEK